MNKRSRVLWSVAAAVSAWSGWVMLQPQADDDMVARPAERKRAGPAPTARRAASLQPTGDVCTTDAVLPVRQALAEQAQGDPFGRAAPKVAAAPAPVQVVLAPPPPPPPPPPTLPYRYLGMLAERDGSQPQVFLLKGDKLIVAHVGDVLEGGFRLDAVQPRGLRFVRPSDNVTLTLSVEEGIAS
ncbi:MAG: hypothetical protein RLY71_171 [Pseudomonadota bacterium]|jgi:hypothetical protein